MNAKILPLGFAFSLSACATMDAQQCATVEWNRVGQIDGQRGLPASYVDNHKAACKDAGRAVTEVEYEAGRQQGLQEYCTPAGGFLAGSQGKYYQNVCAKEIEPEFMTQFHAGRQVWNLKSERERLREEKKRREEELREDHSLIGDISKGYYLLSGTSPTEEMDHRDNQLTDEIFKREAASPAGRLSLQPQINMSGMESAGGSMLGTVLGFGVGHAIQGRYRADGLKWTAIDAGVIASMVTISNSCPGDMKVESSGRAGLATPECSVLAPVSLLAFLGARVWQSVELWRHTARAFSPYQEHKNSSFLPEYVSTVPVSNTIGVGAGWGFP